MAKRYTTIDKVDGQGRHFVCRVGLQVGALGAIEILYDSLFLLETVGPETPPSNLCFHIDSTLPWSPNGGKSAASMGLPQGAASHKPGEGPCQREAGENSISPQQFHLKSNLLMTYVNCIG